MSGEHISVKPGYDAAKSALQNTVDAFTPAEGSRPSDLAAAMDAATSSGTPSLARVIELLKAVSASAAEDHAAGVATLESGMTTVNSWVASVGNIDAAGADAVVTGDGGVPETVPAESPAGAEPRRIESVPGVSDSSPKRLGK